MLLVLSTAGFGVGTPELAIWFILLVAGFAVVLRRARRARAGAGGPSRES
jgi:hypothetical protein